MTVPNFMSKALFFRIYAVEREGGGRHDLTKIPRARQGSTDYMKKVSNTA